MLLKAVAVWFVLMVLAIANGVFWNSIVSPRIGEHGGHIFSTMVLCFIILVVAWGTIDWIGPRTGREALQVGVLWVAMTLGFEFLAGHYVFGNPWEKLFADYNIAGGRIWALVPVASLIAPRLAAAMKGLFEPPAT
jgi:hypothetical protein